MLIGVNDLLLVVSTRLDYEAVIGVDVSNGISTASIDPGVTLPTLPYHWNGGRTQSHRYFLFVFPEIWLSDGPEGGAGG